MPIRNHVGIAPMAQAREDWEEWSNHYRTKDHVCFWMDSSGNYLPSITMRIYRNPRWASRLKRLLIGD